MKTQELLKQVKKFDKPQLKEYISNLPMGEIIDTMVDMVVNYPQEQLKNEQLIISKAVKYKLIELIEENFRTPREGIGRKSVYETSGYNEAVKRLLYPFINGSTTPIPNYNFRLRNLFDEERTRRIENGEDVTNFVATSIEKDGTITNAPTEVQEWLNSLEYPKYING